MPSGPRGAVFIVRGLRQLAYARTAAPPGVRVEVMASWRAARGEPGRGGEPDRALISEAFD